MLNGWGRGTWTGVVGIGGAALATLLGGCGSGGGGGGDGSSGPSLRVVHFLQSGVDNVPLNRVLEIAFSDTVDLTSVDSDSIQVRMGPSFGQSVEGRYIVEGSRVFFEPLLPSDCTLGDAGLRPDTDYRVTIIGSPEEFAIRSTTGHSLEETVSFTFRTRGEDDPQGLFDDQVPGAFPTVVSTSPVDGAHPVPVAAGNKVVIHFSENIDPCSISPTTVRIHQYATGNPAEFPNGFNPDADQTPGDPTTWGSGTATSPPQRIRATYVLTQDFVSTRLEIVPDFGEFPDNALIVVALTSDVQDFGGNPLVAKTFAFVTENRAEQCQAKTLQFDGDVAVDENLSTADVDTARAPGRAQGFLLFAGDGDNGASPTVPSGPDCAPYHQDNDGTPDDFDTPTGDVILDTGASPNTTCDNETDGTRAVIFEFRTFRIRTGRTVTIVGRNPAIILVAGDVVIESGGRLLARGGNGGNGAGYNYPSGNPPSPGGTAVAGGGAGGNSSASADHTYSQNGHAGFGSPDYLLPPGDGGPDPVRIGPGRGTSSISTVGTSYTTTANLYGPSGGGAGHASAGASGTANGSGSTPKFFDNPPDGAGGGTYGDITGKMLAAEAGSGGGSGGLAEGYYSAATYNDQTGGGGGGGGGFVDITAEGSIQIFGTIDVSGGRGGAGGGNNAWTAGGGGGGGSGGGVRLLTPNDIELSSTTLITAVGGLGGTSGIATQSHQPALMNNGGSGGVGRLIFEDSDSVLDGYAGAQVVPGESSSAGFYRGVFDASRFQGGGLVPVLVTQVIDVGPTFPTFAEPVQTYGGQEDFVAGIPAGASRGAGATSILVEVQGYPVTADGAPDLTSPTGWKQIGYFTDSGAESFPTWNTGTPPDVTLPLDSTPGGFAAVNDHEFVQFRISFYLKSGMGPFDPGPYIDAWTLHFCYDQ